MRSQEEYIGITNIVQKLNHKLSIKKKIAIAICILLCVGVASLCVYKFYTSGQKEIVEKYISYVERHDLSQFDRFKSNIKNDIDKLVDANNNSIWSSIVGSGINMAIVIGSYTGFDTLCDKLYNEPIQKIIENNLALFSEQLIENHNAFISDFTNDTGAFKNVDSKIKNALSAQKITVGEAFQDHKGIIIAEVAFDIITTIGSGGTGKVIGTGLKTATKSLENKYLKKITTEFTSKILKSIKQHARNFLKAVKKYVDKLPEPVKKFINERTDATTDTTAEMAKEKIAIGLKDSIILSVNQSLSDKDGLYNYMEKVLTDFQKKRREAILALF